MIYVQSFLMEAFIEHLQCIVPNRVDTSDNTHTAAFTTSFHVHTCPQTLIQHQYLHKYLPPHSHSITHLYGQTTQRLHTF